MKEVMDGDATNHNGNGSQSSWRRMGLTVMEQGDGELVTDRSPEYILWNEPRRQREWKQRSEQNVVEQRLPIGNGVVSHIENASEFTIVRRDKQRVIDIMKENGTGHGAGRNIAFLECQPLNEWVLEWV